VGCAARCGTRGEWGVHEGGARRLVAGWRRVPTPWGDTGVAAGLLACRCASVFVVGWCRLLLVAAVWQRCAGGACATRVPLRVGDCVLTGPPVFLFLFLTYFPLPWSAYRRYTSLCPLRIRLTPSLSVLASMHGDYTLVSGDTGGKSIKVDVPKFHLILPPVYRMPAEE